MGDTASLVPAGLLYVSGCDGFRDEGLACAEKVLQCGVAVICLLKQDLTHGYLNLCNNPANRAASKLADAGLDDAAARISKGLSGGSSAFDL